MNTIFITGASTGIGKALADNFNSKGWLVLAAARRIKLLEKNRKNIKNKKKYIPIRLDITKRDMVDKTITKIFDKHGFPQIIVLNAGTNNPNSKEIFKMEELKRIYNVNFFGTLNCVNIILKLKKKISIRSQLVIISSVAGYRGLPYSAAYCSSKAALTNFAESIYHQCKVIGLRVRVINPGFVKTPLTDKNQFKMPLIISAEIAANLIYKKLLYGNSFEINVPKLFCILMKIIRTVPYSVYFRFTSLLLKKL